MLWGFAQTLWFLERHRDEQNDANGRKSHQASCDQARTVVSKDLGHLVPPFVSGKKKEVRAEFPAGRPLLISTFAFAAGAPVPPTFLCPGLGYVRFGSLADIETRSKRGLLCPRKRTRPQSKRMSAKCHKQTCCDMSATWLRLLFD
jgi:hypothetical protein